MKYETTANLSKESIDNLIKNLKDYNKDLQEAKKHITRALSEYTQWRAREYLKDSLIHPDLSTGKLSESIRIQNISDEVAKVYTDLYYAAYVEFGTGVKGSLSDYGTKRFGDISYNQEFEFGQPAHRYMYNAVTDLEMNYVKIARKVLKSWGLI